MATQINFGADVSQSTLIGEGSNAVLLCDISYQKRGQTIVVKKGTRINVDELNLIGCDGSNHFHIATSEYFIVNPLM